MKLILTSDFPSTGSEIVIEHMHSVAKQPRIAWIPPFTGDHREHFVRAQEQLRMYGFDNLEYFDIDHELDETRLSHLDQYDILYLSGGDPLRFRLNLLHAGLPARLQRFLDEGRLLVAASGGSMQLAQNVSLYRLQKASVDDIFMDRHQYQALGFVPYELLPHFNRLAPEFLDKVRQYSERVEHDILAISDGSAVLHRDRDDYRCVGWAVRFRNGLVSTVC